MLRWARETAGLSIEAAARKLQVRPDKVRAWEEADARPTVVQLRKAADAYKRPLAAFFLPAVPAIPALPHDFRRLPTAGSPSLSPELRLELRRARRRRAVALELVDELELPVQEFSIRGTINEDPESLAGRLREWLGVDLATQASWSEKYAALNGWIARFEALGVLVFQASKVDLAEMRGFSVSEPVLPLIVLNGQDFPRARVFTLHHELAHLVLREGGVCDPLSRFDADTRDARVEVFCNRVAGAILVPAQALLESRLLRANNVQLTDNDLGALADQFAVSRVVVLRRLLILGRIGQTFYERKADQYQQEYAERMRLEREARKARPKDKKGGPPRATMVVRDNGRVFTSLVLDALERQKITYADVSDYLGTQLKHLDAITDRVSSSSISGEE